MWSAINPKHLDKYATWTTSKNHTEEYFFLPAPGSNYGSLINLQLPVLELLGGGGKMGHFSQALRLKFTLKNTLALLMGLGVNNFPITLFFGVLYLSNSISNQNFEKSKKKRSSELFYLGPGPLAAPK